jgi:hypothetical protein
MVPEPPPEGIMMMPIGRKEPPKTSIQVSAGVVTWAGTHCRAGVDCSAAKLATCLLVC